MKDVKSNAELNEVLENNARVLVYWSASWCGPCKRLKPQIEQADEKLTNVTFVRIMTDEADPELVSDYNIQAVPQLFEYADGEQVAEIEQGPWQKIVSQLA